MEQAKFKIGDTVEAIGDQLSHLDTTIFKIRGGDSYKIVGFDEKSNPLILAPNGEQRYMYPSQIRHATMPRSKPALPPKFILQYELDSDPFEVFCTEKELRARIAELAEKPELKRDSIKVYDIKRVRTVKLGVKITISK